MSYILLNVNLWLVNAWWVFLHEWVSSYERALSSPQPLACVSRMRSSPPKPKEKDGAPQILGFRRITSPTLVLEPSQGPWKCTAANSTDERDCFQIR